MSGKVQTRGKGAGGANTNKTGLSYEKLTNLSTEYEIIKEGKNFNKVQFKENEKKLIVTKGTNLFTYLGKFIDTKIPRAHGCKKPDECYINRKQKIIFIIEKKFQQVNGSVCEKIQTTDFKKWQYSRTFPEYHIVFIFCLSEWFKKNCEAELEYLECTNVPVFWGNDEDYKKKIVNFITNYKL